MSRFRYGSSLILTALLYALLIALYINFLHAKEVISKPKEHVLKIAVLAPPPIPKKIVKPIVVPPKPKPKVEKPKPKKVVKKPKPKPKKIVKRTKPKPKPIIEEIYEEPIIEVSPPKTIISTNSPVPILTPKVDIEAKKRVFLNRIRSSIHANKKYPKMAKRRNIQGTVHAIFNIQADGTVTNIRLSGASNILQKAVRKSILRSFPTAIPTEIRRKFPMVDVSVNVDFILE